MIQQRSFGRVSPVPFEIGWSPQRCFAPEVVDLVFAMEDMERGLEEMAQSVEHMQEMLKRSPMVQALAQRKPEVRALSALRRHQGNVVLRAKGQIARASFEQRVRR